MTFLGLMAGCLTIYYGVFALLHWLVLKRILANRYASNLAAAALAYPGSILLTGYWRTEYLSWYLVPSLITLGLAWLRGRQAERRADAALSGTFR